MIKLSALNDESEEESGSEEDVTREALEQIALQQYSKALDLQRKGNLKDATQLIKDLLDTELLYEVQKPGPGEKAVGPLFNLKYLCYKNLASMLAAADDIDAAIESYCAASDLDDTDVTLWHRLGLLCMQAKRYEMALHAFQRGADRNPRHWPCLDKIVTLLLGLDYKEECISIIYDTLQLDPGYLRGLAYRKHIYTDFPYIRDFMKYLNPIYDWNEKEDEHIDEESAEKLIKEATDIHDVFIEQQRAEQFKYKLPDLKLKKPISEFTWQSVGDSLVHMHHYMTENFFSHACYLELVYEKQNKEDKKDEPMEVCEDVKPTEAEIMEVTENEMKANTEAEKEQENVEKTEAELNENNNSDKEKAIVTDTEKCESDVEMMVPETVETRTENEGKTNDNQPEPKKKAVVRRRGSDLSFLQQWEWCNKRRSGRKKPANRQDQLDDNIYDTLRRMVPSYLSPEMVQKKENQARSTSPDTRDLNKLFEEKDQVDPESFVEYFGTENEQKDVNQFIDKYMETKRDIIDMLKDVLSVLAKKWKTKWPEGLAQTFIEANKCYNNHIDVPTCTDDNREELIHYTTVNILVEEFSINEKFNSPSEDKETHELSVVDAIGITLYLKPHIFTGIECLELILRQLWAKMHIHILNKKEDFALDCLYQLLCEFEAMGEHQDTYSLELVNFTFKPTINEAEILTNIKFLERNKKLATVMDLYDRGNYEEVLAIVIDSFEHCKTMARNQEEEMSLDFAVQLSIILDTYWALEDVDNCFKWSLVCLHEALKHYFRYTSGSPEYDKWSLTVVKVLCCMEHILTTEGLACLDSISPKDLSQGLDDIIRIIGHQVETTASDMPFGTVIPWAIMHYILQREEDKGMVIIDKDSEEIPNPLLILFIAHEKLGNRGWCCKSDGKLLYFILDTVVPRLRSPALAKCLEQVCQCMEQCVYCLYNHPSKKNKLFKYLAEHNVTPRELNWERAQQVYEIFRPLELPELEGKISGISTDTEVLFRRILAQLPPEYDPQKYVASVKNYIKGTEDKLPIVPSLLPYKMKDIYFLLGDYHFKKEDGKLAVKYNILDVVVNNDRLKAWAEISLAKALNLETILHSCKNLNNEREFLNPAKSIIRCFKRSLELDPRHCTLWIEYGMFVYTVHSFCSRLLKQASESLSMEDFESLEKQKEDMLDTTQKCFMTVLNDLNSSNDGDKSNEDSWLHYYMLGKVAEKRNKPPSVYLDYYMKGVKSLQEADASYPTKINYNSPSHLSIEVLELHYRIHASILKYIEQHESKPIPTSVGRVFTQCIEEWKNGPYMKKPKKDIPTEVESANATRLDEPVHAANILKRSISDVGEEETHESKLMKLEAAAAKVRRSASYDTERLAKEVVQSDNKEPSKVLATPIKEKPDDATTPKPDEVSNNAPETLAVEKVDTAEKPDEKEKSKSESDKKEKEDSSSSTSSSSSSESSSSDSTSSSSDSSRDSAASTSSNDAKPLSEEEIMKIVGTCLDALEDCASRFPPHYKAIYRVAHYHFYYKKGKDIERCRDLMLTSFAARAGQKLAGLFSERKPSNFFNNIWKIPQGEVDRAGGFAFHMSRAVLLTMEILKEIDDHKTLLDLSLQLQRIPEPDKKYLRDSDREELSQQAFSLCVQSLKGQLTKFSQQPDLRKNNIEQQALKSLMLDIYRAYQRAQKQPNSKQFTNLLIEGYKLLHVDSGSETLTHQYYVDQSMKFCQRHIQQLKHEATMASLDKMQTAQKKQVAKQQPVEVPKPSTSTVTPTTKADPKPSASTSTSTSSSFPGLPKMSPQEMSAAFQNYLPIMNDPTQQTAALLTYLNSMNAYAGIPSFQKSLQSTLQSSYQSSFQAEFFRQFLGQTLASYLPPPPKKQKRGPKTASTRLPVAPMKQSKSFTSTTKAAPTPVITSLQKSTSAPLAQKPSLAPSMGTVLPTLPASLTANLAPYGSAHSSHSSAHTSHSNVHTSHSSVHTTMPSQAHMSTASTVSAAIHTKPPLPHQQVSPGKTLQEKLAERQKHLPTSKSLDVTDRHKHPPKTGQDINASISKLPSSLTITKTSTSKQPVVPKKPDAKKSLSFSQPKPVPKPISSDEVIVLDDD